MKSQSNNLMVRQRVLYVGRLRDESWWRENSVGSRILYFLRCVISSWAIGTHSQVLRKEECIGCRAQIQQDGKFPTHFHVYVAIWYARNQVYT